MAVPNYGMNFGNMTPEEIAVRFSYGKVRVALWIATGIPENQRGEQLTRKISNLEKAAAICLGEFIPGARNVH
jgi:hypothetical protein